MVETDGHTTSRGGAPTPLAEVVRRLAATALRARPCSIAIAAPNGNGRLGRVVEAGSHLPTGPRAAAARRAAFRSGRIRSVDTDRTTVLFVPISHDGHPRAVVEIEVPRSTRPDERSVLDVAEVAAVLMEAERCRDEASMALERGLALTAHEILGPLAGVRAVIDRFLDGQAGTGDLREARSELERVVGSVGSLLEHGVRGMEAVQERVDLVSLARELESSIEPAGSDRLTVHTNGPVTVSGDRVQLRSALGNLVVNALAYSPRREPVRVAVGSSRFDGLVDVTDRGPGIPNHLLSTIFEPLVRGSEPGNGRTGHGLGLFLAKRVIEAHGGGIEVASRPGSTAFRVRLPLATGVPA